MASLTGFILYSDCISNPHLFKAGMPRHVEGQNLKLSVHIKNFVDEYLKKTYPLETSFESRVKRYINRDENVRIPFTQIDEIYQLPKGKARSHFQNYIANTAYE